MPKTLSRISSTYRTRRRWTSTDAKDALAALAQSGLPVSVFAAREGLNISRLFRWRRQLGANALTTQTFEEVVHREMDTPLADGVTAQRERDRFEIVLRSGLVVRVAESFTPDALRRLLAVVGEERS